MSVTQNRNYAKEITLAATYVKEEIGFPANNMTVYNYSTTVAISISLDGVNPALLIGPGQQVTVKDFMRFQRFWIKGEASIVGLVSAWKSEDR